MSTGFRRVRAFAIAMSALTASLLAGCGLNFAGSYEGTLVAGGDCTAEFGVSPTLAFAGYGSGSTTTVNYNVTGTWSITITGPDPCPFSVGGDLVGTASSSQKDFTMTADEQCGDSHCPIAVDYTGLGEDSNTDNNADRIIGSILIQPIGDPPIGPGPVTFTRLP